MLDLTAHTDSLGPHDVIRGTPSLLYKQVPIFPPLYLCKHIPNYPTTPSCIPTQPTNFHLGPSSSSRTSEEQSRASLCLARSAPRPPSRFARLHPRHVVSPCRAQAGCQGGVCRRAYRAVPDGSKTQLPYRPQ